MSSNTPKYKKTVVPLSKGEIEVYATPALAISLHALLELKVYEGSKIISLIEAVYKQGKKDGAREVIEKFDVMKSQISYRNPGGARKS